MSHTGQSENSEIDDVVEIDDIRPVSARESLWHVELTPAAPGIPPGASEDKPLILCDDNTGEVSMVASNYVARVDTYESVMLFEPSRRQSAAAAGSASAATVPSLPYVTWSGRSSQWKPQKPCLWPVKNMTAARDIHFSQDCRYISIVKTRNDIDIVHTPTVSIMHISREKVVKNANPSAMASVTAYRSLPSSKSVSVPKNSQQMILGCVWPFPNTLLVVATDALELYAIQCIHGKIRAFLVKVIHSESQWFRYIREKQLLLVCTGTSMMNVLVLEQQQNQKENAQIKLMPSFNFIRTLEIARPRALDVVPSWEAGFVLLYGEPYIAQVVASGDTEKKRRNKAALSGEENVEIVLWPVCQTSNRPSGAPDGGPLSSSSSSSRLTNNANNPLISVPASATVGVKRLPTPFGTTSMGDVRFQVVDNLLIVHSFTQKTSLVYDIRIPDFPALPLSMAISPNTPNPPFPGSDKPPVTVYSSEQTAFAGTSFVVDLEDGALWKVGVNLENIMRGLNNKVTLVLFLLRREEGKPYILRVLREMILDTRPLRQVGSVFDRLNIVLASHMRKDDHFIRASSVSAASSPNLMRNSQSQHGRSNRFADIIKNRLAAKDPLSSSAIEPLTRTDASSSSLVRSEIILPSSSSSISQSSSSTTPTTTAIPTGTNTGKSTDVDMSGVESRLNSDGFIVVTQRDMFEYVFSTIEEDKDVPAKYLIAVLTEYIRTLNYNLIAVEPFLYSKLIEVLVKAGRFQQLCQFIQYHIIGDSVHVAFQLVSLEAQYPPAYQMALDMLKRLGEDSTILEVLLAKKQLVQALRFTCSLKDKHLQDANSFLKAAVESGDRALLYNVYTFFKARHQLPKDYSIEDAERALVAVQQQAAQTD